jgi:hypothetical protein
LQPQDFDLWAGTEYASLQTAPPVTPSPSPTATAFEKATCPGALTSCLMPLPTGSFAVTGQPTTYSIASFVSGFIVDSAATSATQELRSDNVTTIDAETWGLSNGDGVGLLVLLQTRTDSQAQDLLTNLPIGSYPTDLSIPGFSQALGSYLTTKDSQGYEDGLIVAQTGTVYMLFLPSFHGSFDVSTAQSWTTQELDLLSKRTQGDWGFPIPQVTTPTLPPFAAGSCSGAAPADCVMPVPSGATQAGTGAAVQDVGVSGLASAVYSDQQTYEQTWLTDDGIGDVSAEHWTASDGATGADYVMIFASSRQAEAAARQMAADGSGGAQSCTDSSLPGVDCIVLPEDDSTGAVPIRITASNGRYAVDLEVSQSDAADTSDALAWAQAQLERLGGD